MAPLLIKKSSHEAENQYEVSLRLAFDGLQPQLRPPFPLTIPDQQEYIQLNRAILYGVLCEPRLAEIHIKHLHAKVSDGYCLFVSLLVRVVNELYVKLVDPAKRQVIWVTKLMIDVLGVGVDGLLVCLLRRIVGGDFSDENIWLCSELVSVLIGKWDCLLEEAPFVLNGALYTFLRLLADHYRFSGDVKLDTLKRLEIDFCVKMLREQFHLCLKIGRDLVRLLQDLIDVPEFRAIWKDLVLNPKVFKTPGFLDISELYHLRTSSWYFLLRITPEMESQLRFLLTHVKFGSQMRYQVWFAKKFLLGPERESLIVDIVRFICCGHHPSNEIIQSDVIPRWAVIGWLLTCCRKNYVEAKVKLALFYDWLFFKESVDNIMNIEPAMLLMVCSIPKYIAMTHTLLDFLLLLVENYDVDHSDIIVRGVASAFGALVQKGVVRSLDVLTSCKELYPLLKEKLRRFLSGMKVGFPKESQPLSLSSHPSPTINLPTPAPSPETQPTNNGEHGLTRSVDACHPPPTINLPTPTPSPERQPTNNGDHGLTRSADATSLLINRENHVDSFESLVQNLGETIRNSSTMGLEILEEVLFSLVRLGSQQPVKSSICPEVVSSKIAKEFELNSYKLFPPLEHLPDAPYHDDEIGSATALIIRTFIFSQDERMRKMLLSWSKNGYLVGARLLSYAARLAQEADVVKNAMGDINYGENNYSGMKLLTFHVDGYFSFLNRRKGDSSKSFVCTSKVDKEFAAKLVDRAFTAYRCFLAYKLINLRKEADTSLSKLLFSDLTLCSRWEKERLKFLLGSIFCHLADLSVSKEDIIKLIVSQLDHADIIDMQLEISLKKYSIFGEITEIVSHLIKNSLYWNCPEQHKFWGLIRSELAVSKVQVEKIILEFFCSRELNANTDAIAVGGLLALCNSCAPTPELVGTIMLLPNNVFQDFAAAALAVWAASNASMLFDSLSEFSEKFDNRNGHSTFSNKSVITINRSAILWLLDHFNAQGITGFNVLTNLSSASTQQG